VEEERLVAEFWVGVPKVVEVALSGDRTDETWACQ
jgi:hypothetical protein